MSDKIPVVQVTLNTHRFMQLSDLIASEIRHQAEMLLIENKCTPNAARRGDIIDLIGLAADIGLHHKELEL